MKYIKLTGQFQFLNSYEERLDRVESLINHAIMTRSGDDSEQAVILLKRTNDLIKHELDNALQKIIAVHLKIKPV